MNAKHPDVVGQARSASRWMRILGLYDVLAALAAVIATVLFLTTGPAGLMVLPFGALAFAFFGYRAHHQLGAARKIRSGVERGDGAAFAAGFAHLRKLLIVAFALNLGALIFGGGL